jgi:hypothetical protein
VRISSNGRRILTACWNGGLCLWDSDAGLPLTEWLFARGVVADVCFDLTGQRLAAATQGARVWNFPETPTPVPAWFPDFAEAVAGLRLSERGSIELVPQSEFQQRAAQIAAKKGDGFYERLGRWFFMDSKDRPAHPF